MGGRVFGAVIIMTDEEALTLDEAFGMCMELWDILSRINNFNVAFLEMKNDILIEVLGYRSCSFGCPFCQYIEGIDGDCGKCPITIYNDGNGCNKTPFEEWENEVFIRDKHSRIKAKRFFDFLCTIYKKHHGREYGEKV